MFVHLSAREQTTRNAFVLKHTVYYSLHGAAPAPRAHIESHNVRRGSHPIDAASTTGTASTVALIPHKLSTCSSTYWALYNGAYSPYHAPAEDLGCFPALAKGEATTHRHGPNEAKTDEQGAQHCYHLRILPPQRVFQPLRFFLKRFGIRREALRLVDEQLQVLATQQPALCFLSRCQSLH